MDSPPIIGDDTEEEKSVIGKLVLKPPDGNGGDSSLTTKCSSDGGGKHSKHLFETGKTWLSKLSASGTSNQHIQASHVHQHNTASSSESISSPSKPIGHWPDLLVMDRSDHNYSSTTSQNSQGEK